VLGIVGAFLATFLGQQIGMFSTGEPYGFGWFVASVIGSIIILLIWRQVARSK
jgi:uncharacterized membrane protein YeaQ/YmgE (transglycosylase-associated protein family)